MLKVLNAIKYSRKCFEQQKRTFLSQAYYCNEVWNHRLNNPLLEKVNLDELYHELEQRYQKNGLLSAVDVDIFANSVRDDLYVDELLDLTHKLRMTADTTNTLNSTAHAVVRCLFDANRKEELLNVIDDRLNYGIFLDYYTANILMDKFYKENDFVSGSRIAAQLMLQDEFEHPISTSLAILHCYNYLLNPVGWPEEPKVEEPEEEVKVRVKYLRNAFYDDHFDIKDPNKMVGKILATATKNCKDDLGKSLHLLGLGLHEKHEKASELIKKFIGKLSKGVCNLLPDDNPTRKELEKLQNETIDIKDILENRVKEAERQLAEKDVALQCETYVKWEQERKQALEKQKERLMIANRITNIKETQENLKQREEKLWFFENEENIELGIEAKKIYYPKRWFGKKKKPRKIDEGYIPPEL